MGVNYIPVQGDTFKVKGDKNMYVCTDIGGTEIWRMIICKSKDTNENKSFPVMQTFFDKCEEIETV